MIPVYGFLEGDTMGLLVFSYEHETVRELALKLQHSARVRVMPRENFQVIFKGKSLDPGLKISESGLAPLDRFDVVWSHPL